MAKNFTGEKKLTFDLLYVNKHMKTRKIKYDDWKCFENSLNVDSKYVKFDLKTNYYYIRETLTWDFHEKNDGKVRHLVLTVVPGGLDSVPFCFRKIDRFSVNY